MKPVDNDRFEVYQKQGRSLRLSADARCRILEAVRSQEAPETAEPPSAPHGGEKAVPFRTQIFPAAFTLKAACLLIAIGVGLPVIFASLPSREFEPPQAIATSPLRPYERIEVHYLDSSVVSTSEEALCVTPITLYISGLSSSRVTITLQDSDGVYLSPDCSPPTEATPRNTALQADCPAPGEIHLQLFCSTNITQEQFNEGFLSTNSPNWTSTEPVKLIQRLRGSQLTIEDDSGNKVALRIELDGFPTSEAIAAQLRRGNDYVSPYFCLDRKELP